MYEEFYGFSERPFQLTPDPAGGHPDGPEGQGNAEGHDGRVHAEHAQSVVVGLSGNAHQHEGRGVRAEQGHEQDQGSQPTARQEELLRGPACATRGQGADDEHGDHVQAQGDGEREERIQGDYSSSIQMARQNHAR